MQERRRILVQSKLEKNQGGKSVFPRISEIQKYVEIPENTEIRFSPLSLPVINSFLLVYSVSYTLLSFIFNQ